MRVIDPGHQYALTHLDGNLEELLTFVKREGDRYPGNVGSHEGTNLQEVIRALIDRVKYLDNQIPHWRNKCIITSFRDALEHLEYRAAMRHGRDLHLNPNLRIEEEPVCNRCGHIGCECTSISPESAAPRPFDRLFDTQGTSAEADPLNAQGNSQ